MLSKNCYLPNRPGVYATKEDFCRIFSQEMQSLYLLSLLLTADHKKAEQCFVTGLDRCSEGRPVFNEWARSWTRRIIVQNAIRMISPKANPIRETSVLTVTSITAYSENQAFLLAITQLPPFERFALVLSTLERYSDRDCRAFLGCSAHDLVNARTRAIELLPVLHSRSQTLQRSEKIDPAGRPSLCL
jgi:DNA-directed RNA polymerase specialized sigma24 family protein